MSGSERYSRSWNPTDDVYSTDFDHERMKDELLYEYEGWIVCINALVAHRCADGEFGKPEPMERYQSGHCKHCRVELSASTLEKLNKIYLLMKPQKPIIYDYQK